MVYNLKLLYELRCIKCNNYYLYCSRSGGDFRCINCKGGHSLEEVQLELDTMSDEERESFEKDIEEYEKEHGKIKDGDHNSF